MYRYVQCMSYLDMNILQIFLMPQPNGFEILQYRNNLQVSCSVSVIPQMDEVLSGPDFPSSDGPGGALVL